MKTLFKEFTVNTVLTPSKELSDCIIEYNELGGTVIANTDANKAAIGERNKKAAELMSEILERLADENTKIRQVVYDNCLETEYPVGNLIGLGLVPQMHIKFQNADNGTFCAALPVAKNIHVDVEELMDYAEARLKAQGELKTASGKKVIMPKDNIFTYIDCLKYFLKAKKLDEFGSDELFRVPSKFTGCEFRYVVTDATNDADKSKMTSKTTLKNVLQQIVEDLIGENCLENFEPIKKVDDKGKTNGSLLKVMSCDVNWLLSIGWRSSNSTQCQFQAPNHKQIVKEVVTVTHRLINELTYTELKRKKKTK